MEDTVTDGRLDIVIFPNGGREFLGKLPSNPETPEELYLPLVKSFVDAHQNLDDPEKFTGMYKVRNNQVEITWGPYAGEIPNYISDVSAHSIEYPPEEAERLRAMGFNIDDNGHPVPPSFER